MAYPTQQTDPEQDPQGYLERVWSSFLALSPSIIDLQHRAALDAQSARAQGNAEAEATARLIIEELAKLQQIHHQVVSWAERAGAMVGLGAIQLPIGVAGVTVAALLVAWAFRKYAAQERALDLLEQGLLTPEEFAQLDILDPPGIGTELAGITGGVGKWVVGILLAWALLEAVKRGTFQRNPPLVFFDNPPGIMSEDVKLIGYEHAEDGELYLHEFAGGVEMEALPDGSISIRHPSRRVWREFSL